MTRQRHPANSSDGVRVAVIHDYLHRAGDLADWSRVQAKAEVVFFSEHFLDEEEVVAALEGFDVICAMREYQPFRAELLRRLPRLRLLVATGMVNHKIDFDAAEALGIEVAATANGTHGRIATAELTWALILATTRNLLGEDAATRGGRWQTSLSWGLEGRTIGIVGLGAIGRMIAAYAHVFGMKTLAWSRHLSPMVAKESKAEFVPFDELLARSDVVTLHMVPSHATEHLIDARALALMKPNAFLINTSRGALIDEAALVDALQNGRLAGAGLDVFEREPLEPSHPLLDLRNVIVSPHLGGFTTDTIGVWYQGSAEAVEAFLDGEPTPFRHIRNP